MINITGWGAFWTGVFGFLTFRELFHLIQHIVIARSVKKTMAKILETNPELLKKSNVKF